MFPTITSGLKDFTQELYSGSPGQVRLNSELVAMPFARVHSSDRQSWWVTPVNSKMSSSARMLLPPPHPMATAFGSVGTEPNGWARGLCPIGWVSTGGKSGVKVTAASTVRDSALFIETFYVQFAQRYTIKHWTLRASVGPSRRGVARKEVVDRSSTGLRPWERDNALVFGYRSPLELHAVLRKP